MRKIISHLKENWIRYGFETFVVVVGILAAYSLNNWNQQVKIKLEEQILLEGLQTEMLKNRLELNKKIELHLSGMNHHESLLQIFEEEPVTNNRHFNDSLWNNAIGPKLFATYDPLYGNVKSIITSGKLGYITNLKLTAQISSFEDKVNDMKEAEPIIEKIFHNHVGPLSYDYVPHDMFGKLIYQSDFYGFSKDKKLFPHFMELFYWRQSLLTEEKNLLTEIDKMLDLIEKELKSDSR